METASYIEVLMSQVLAISTVLLLL